MKNLFFILLGVIFGITMITLYQTRPQIPAAPLATKIIIKPSVRADIIKIIDGDTLEVKGHLWVGLEKQARIRIADINTPEKRHKPGCRRCAQEKKLAHEAAAYLAELVGQRAQGGYRPIFLYDIDRVDNYGRVLAGVMTADGTDIGAALIERGLAHAHRTNEKACWCGLSRAHETDRK